MSQPHQGRLIRASVFDRQGRNPKVRPLLVTTPTSELSRVDEVATVAVTGEFSVPNAPDEIELPWQANGRCKTKLTKRCVAKCGWQPIVRIADIVDYKGTVPQLEMERVLEILSRIESGELVVD